MYRKKLKDIPTTKSFSFMILNVILLRFIISNCNILFLLNALIYLLPFFFEVKANVPTAM